jgi:SAM-dependent methyltransferase
MRPASWLSKYLFLMQFDIHKAMMHYKLKHIAPQIKGRWLDVGAGDQPYKKYFAGVNEYLTTNTRRHYNTERSKQLEGLTTFWIEDGKALPLPDHSLDGIACFQVLSVIDKPEEFFIELNRVLKPGGKLLLTTDFLYPAWSNEDRYRHTAFNLKQLSESTGFKVEVLESFGGFGSTVYSLFMRYMRSFPEIWKRKNIFAKAISVILYLLLIILLPVISLNGLLIFQFEKNNIRNIDFTFNLLLSATKKYS